MSHFEIWPALRGKMGDWVYYVTPMKLAKVAKETRFVEDIHKSDELDELMQREIGERVRAEMVPYLLNQPQHFYGALIVAVYGGEPEFSPVRIAEHELLDDSDSTSYGFGLLRFDGSQMYFALDGQHRLKSIQLALEHNPDLGREEIVVIIVRHDNTPEGLSRTRRLFSTLNRRAEKTKVGLNIAIDEDDPIAITARRLVREHPFLGKMKMVKANKEGLNSKQITPTPANESYLTTLQSLYESNEILLRAFGGGMDVDAAFKANRPDADTLDLYYDFLARLWSDIFELCPDLKPVIEGRQKPGSLRIDLRSGGGGSAIARPIGQFIVAEFLSSAMRQGQEQREIIERLFREVSFTLDDAPWRKLVWNPEARSIVGGKKERSLVVSLLLDKFGLKTSTSKRELLKSYRDITQDKRMRLLGDLKNPDGSDAPDAPDLDSEAPDPPPQADAEATSGASSSTWSASGEGAASD